MTIVLNGTVGITDVNGSASAPAITGTVSTNTGMWFPAANTVAWSTNGTEGMRLDSSQNLGIGTSSPTSFGAGYTVLDVYNGTTGGYILARSPNITGQLAVDNSIGMYLQTRTNHPILFLTNNTERARIDTSGNLLVGTTSNPNSAKIAIGPTASNGISIESNSTAVVMSQLLFRNPNGVVGSVTTSGTNTAYNTSSDYRLKENVQPMQNALATIAQLKPVTYDWIADKSKGQGFIAHELQAVVPDCVTGAKDAVDAEGKPVYQGVDTSFLVATLTAAIQEQQAIINDLQAKLKSAGIAGF